MPCGLWAIHDTNTSKSTMQDWARLRSRYDNNCMKEENKQIIISTCLDIVYKREKNTRTKIFTYINDDIYNYIWQSVVSCYFTSHTYFWRSDISFLSADTIRRGQLDRLLVPVVKHVQILKYFTDRIINQHIHSNQTCMFTCIPNTTFLLGISLSLSTQSINRLLNWTLDDHAHIHTHYNFQSMFC